MNSGGLLEAGLLFLLIALATILWFSFENGFWAWLNNSEHEKDNYGPARRVIAAIIVFLVAPVLFYYVIKGDTAIQGDEQIPLGLLVVFVLYGVACYFSFQREDAQSRVYELREEIDTLKSKATEYKLKLDEGLKKVEKLESKVYELQR
ncbi:MAG: hypothetical protein K2X29_13435 [Candidatus Obscuribacterales bacterium]|nr:hypothetical protein [Candidatus Obscuribacterales bacterium]